jgi:hypothetical protein
VADDFQTIGEMQMDDINKPYNSAVYDLAVQKAVRDAQDKGKPVPSESELDAIGKLADAKNVYGFDAKQRSDGTWVEQGVGAAGRESTNHFQSIRRYEGQAAYDRAIREIWRRDAKRAAALGLPQPARAGA